MEDQEHLQITEDKLYHFLMGHANAIAFINSLVYVFHLWDDLIDKDKERSPQDISLAFETCILGFNVNPFFRTYINELLPLITSCIMKWKDANVMELSDDDHQVNQAWMLRAGLYDIVHYCAFLVGGQGWIEQVGVDIRCFYQEKLGDFKKEMEVLKCQHH